MKRFDDEKHRIIRVYNSRDAQMKRELYSWCREDVLYTSYRINSIWAQAFIRAGFRDLSKLRILDVGCGSAGWLRMIVEWGATPSNLHGIDLLENRIILAKSLSPNNINLSIGSGWPLSFFDNSIDLCAASTVFSSILNEKGRISLASEMMRVVRPKGWLMIFDYAISNPRNPDTTGINYSEIKKLFPKQNIRKTYRLILAPPILRKIPRNVLWLAHALEIFFPPLCTHRLYAICKE